jgi:hypothetical protein
MIPHQVNNVLSSYRTRGFIGVFTKPVICLCTQPHETSPHPVALRKFLKLFSLLRLYTQIIPFLRDLF